MTVLLDVVRLIPACEPADPGPEPEQAAADPVVDWINNEPAPPTLETVGTGRNQSESEGFCGLAGSDSPPTKSEPVGTPPTCAICGAEITCPGPAGVPHLSGDWVHWGPCMAAFDARWRPRVMSGR